VISLDVDVLVDEVAVGVECTGDGYVEAGGGASVCESTKVRRRVDVDVEDEQGTKL
jgi:hypothetical protein